MSTGTKTLPRPRVLVVDDEEGPRQSLRHILEGDYEVELADSGEQALHKAISQTYDLVLLDILMPGKDGIQVLRELKPIKPSLPIVVISAVDKAQTAVEAIKLGAETYEVKPFDKEKIRSVARMAIEKYRLENEVARIQSEVEHRYKFDNIIGASYAMQQVFALIKRVADTDSTVLIYGESGTGKELVARSLHYNSSRRTKPFIAFDCGAVAKELIESELFGHEKGAFTGALTQRIGLFEAATGGTLFLDEIGEMETGLQSRLLRVLQEKQVRRVGANKPVDVDVRLIAATSRDLSKEIAAGRFREDLFYRINVVPVHLAPLRERAQEDVPLLIKHFTEMISKELSQPEPQFSAEAVQALIAYPWPGNVRELKNCIERVLVLNQGKSVLTAEDLPPHIREGQPAQVATAKLEQTPVSLAMPAVDLSKTFVQEGKTLDEMVAEVERTAISDALRRSNGVVTRAAELLGTTRRILKYKMDQLGIGTGREKGQHHQNPVTN